MKAVKKPIAIDVTVFEASRVPEGVKVKYDNSPESLGWHVFNELHGSWIGVKEGDFLNVTSLQDVYPIDASYFSMNYDVVT